MEDSHIAKFNIAPDIHLFAVFDGHRGKEVALYVEKHFVDLLLANESFKKGDYKHALKDTFMHIDELIKRPKHKKELLELKKENEHPELLAEEEDETNAGCTACVALIAKGELYVGNAGDSRCVVCCDGKAIAMNYDHKLEIREEQERIIIAGGFIKKGRVNGRLNLTRALGDVQFKENPDLEPHEQIISGVPDVTQRKLTEADEFIVVGCDGIWGGLTNQAVVDFIRKRNKDVTPLSKIIEELLDRILAPDMKSNLLFLRLLTH